MFENTQYKFWELVNAWVSIANDELTKGVTPDVEIEYRRTHDWYFCRLGVVRGEDLLTDG